MLSSLLNSAVNLQRRARRRLHSFTSQPSSWTLQGHGRVWETIQKNGLLGFMCFGGPPVHFQILHHRFVDTYRWLEEPMFQELFAVTQALSGPASTKMLYCINLDRNGFGCAVLAFLLWSLPGALGMYALSLGISSVGDTLPAPAYALLSGLNAATVGVIALAAVQLSQKAITDKISRVLVFLGATAGMLYNALWYFPVLIALAGPVTIVWDSEWARGLARWGRRKVVALRNARGRGTGPSGGRLEGQQREEDVEMTTRDAAEPTVVLSGPAGPSHREFSAPISGPGSGSASATATGVVPSSSKPAFSLPVDDSPNPFPSTPAAIRPHTEPQTQPPPTQTPERRTIPTDRRLKVSWKFAALLIVGFLASFTLVMILRGVVRDQPLLFNLFSNLYLAGTIIFGGGPVVIPLLRQYIVAEGWVSSRDFLLGLAIIQSFPGPNFNFAVYLGSLTAINASYPSILGAAISFVAIFAPGLILVHGTMGIWGALRTRRWVKAGLRGINAAAVGLIYTAIYRLWEIGYVDEKFSSGSSLGRDPWWVVVTATSYVGVCWFGVPVPLAILIGGGMGLIRYGVASA